MSIVKTEICDAYFLSIIYLHDGIIFYDFHTFQETEKLTSLQTVIEVIFDLLSNRILMFSFPVITGYRKIFQIFCRTLNHRNKFQDL